MESLDHWSFDVFKLYDITQTRPLLSISYTILQVGFLFHRPENLTFDNDSNNNNVDNGAERP